MQVILLEKVQNLGVLGETVTVKGGYGRNFLVPSGKAVPATPENVAAFEARRAELEQQAAEALAAAQDRAGKLDGQSVTIVCRAGAEGKLFGSVGTADIARAVTDSIVELHRHEVHLPQGSFRETGEYEVVMQLHADVSATVTVRIEAEA